MSEQSQVVDSTVDIPATDATKDGKQDVGTVAERYRELERIIDKLMGVLQRNIKDTIEVDGKDLSLDECAAKIKTLSSNLHDGDLQNHDQQQDLPEGQRDTSITPALKLDGTTTKLDYEAQIGMLKAEIDILRATLQDASDREQHYKILVGQLDMADSRAQQKWESFHNAVVQQWSNHCQQLQRQLSFAAMKLQQQTTIEPREQTTDVERESNSTSEGICLENGEVSTAVTSPSAPPLSESSDDAQEESLDAQNLLHPSARSSMISGMPYPPFPVFSGYAPMSLHDNLNPSPYTNLQPPPPPPLDFQDQPFIPEKMSSARQLHRFFTNLSMIETAQREGRAYRNSDLDYRDQYTDRYIEHAEVSHNPRRARAYGHQYDEEQVVESESFLDAGRDEGDRDAKPIRLTATANPFIPANVTRNVDEH